MRPIRAALLPGIACAIALPAPALAATTIGDTSIAPTEQCADPQSFFQDSSTGPSYAVPAGGGVITSWAFRTGPHAPFAAKLKMWRRTSDPNRFTVIGGDDFHFLPPNATTSFGVRVPVRAGDLLGAAIAAGSFPECSYTAGSGDVERYAPDDTPPGTTVTAGPQSGLRFAISAKVEPDADRDGFGDETQDACPASAAHHRACVLAAPSISGKTEVGETLKAVAAPLQGGAVTYQWLRGSGKSFVPIPGATGSTYNLARSDRGKRLEVTEGVSNPGGSDPATSSPTAIVGPPTLSSSTKKTQRVVKQRGVVVRVMSNLAGTVTATGTIALPNGSARIVRFKRVKRSIAARTTRKLTLRLSRRGLARLKRILVGKRKLKARVTVAVKDPSGGRRSSKIAVTLRR
jgi:hypothetical protein